MLLEDIACYDPKTKVPYSANSVLWNQRSKLWNRDNQPHYIDGSY